MFFFSQNKKLKFHERFSPLFCLPIDSISFGLWLRETSVLCPLLSKSVIEFTLRVNTDSIFESDVNWTRSLRDKKSFRQRGRRMTWCTFFFVICNSVWCFFDSFSFCPNQSIYLEIWSYFFLSSLIIFCLHLGLHFFFSSLLMSKKAKKGLYLTLTSGLHLSYSSYIGFFRFSLSLHLHFFSFVMKTERKKSLTSLLLESESLCFNYFLLLQHHNH